MGKLLFLLDSYHITTENKKEYLSILFLIWCTIRDSPLLPLASANWLSLSLKLSLATNSPPDCLFNAATLSGDGVDRCLRQIKGDGGRESYKRTRGAFSPSQYATITFQGRVLLLYKINKDMEKSMSLLMVHHQGLAALASGKC